MKGVVFDRFEADQLRQRARAQTMWLHRETHEARGQTVQATLFSAQSGQPPRAVLTAPAAETKLKGGITDLHGGVRILDAEGRRLHTEALTYDARKDHVYGAQPVRIEGANFELHGQGLHLMPGQDDLQIVGPVQAIFQPEAKAAAGTP